MLQLCWRCRARYASRCLFSGESSEVACPQLCPVLRPQVRDLARRRLSRKLSVVRRLCPSVKQIHLNEGEDVFDHGIGANDTPPRPHWLRLPPLLVLISQACTRACASVCAGRLTGVKSAVGWIRLNSNWRSVKNIHQLALHRDNWPAASQGGVRRRS